MNPIRQIIQSRCGSGFCLALFVALSGVGCATDSDRSARLGNSSSEVTQLHMLTFPTAINMDAIPGQDGIALKVFAGNAKRDKPFAVREGTLEILLFDGLLKSSSEVQSKPLKTWSFPVDELKKREFKSTIGVGYELTLVWEGQRPKRGRVTVVARLTRESGRTIYSAPSPISINRS